MSDYITDDMIKLPHCMGFYRKREGKYGIKWQVCFPLVIKEKGDPKQFRKTFLSEADAITFLRDLNDFVYFGGERRRDDILDLIAKKEYEKRKKFRSENSLFPTVDKFFEQFIERRKQSKEFSMRTMDKYETIRKRVYPYIGEMRLNEINIKIIEDMLIVMRTNSAGINNAGHAYTGTTLNMTVAGLKTVFQKAVDYELIDKNPFYSVKMPKIDTKEKSALTQTEVQEFFKVLASKPLDSKIIAIYIALFTGCRLSEVLGLKWKDYHDGSLHIERSLERDIMQFKLPKNGEKRVVPVADELKDVLHKWKKIQADYYENFLRLKIPVGERPIVNNAVGKHTIQSNFTRWFRENKESFGLAETFTFHQFRHTFTSLLTRDCNIDDTTTMSLTGHKDKRAFLGYNHTATEYQQNAIGQLAILISPDVKKQICKNCRYWAKSPTESNKGACWLNSSPLKTKNTDRCENFVRG